MDLVLPEATPTADERSAVDAVLGQPTSGWSGGVRTIEAEGRVARGGREAREQRHLLLPALHALQSSAGWISPGGLRYVCERLTVPPAEAYGVATFYAMFSVEPRPTTVLHLCDDIACKVAGAEGLIDEVIRQVGSEQVLRSPCLGMCERAPAALLQVLRLDGRGVRTGVDRTARPVPARRSWTMRAARRSRTSRRRPTAPRAAPAAPPGRRRRSDVARRLPGARRLRGAPPGGRARSRRRDRRAQGLEAPGAGRRRVPRRREVGGGRQAAGQPALLHLQRRRIRAGHVQGPGADGARPVRRPGVADDRRLRDGFEKGFIYIRGEYPNATSRLEHAIEQAYAHGFLGAGRDGARGSRSTSSSAVAPAPTSAARRPRCSTRSRASAASPATSRRSPSSGACSASRPAINNVETLVNVLEVLTLGGEAYARIGTPESTGPRLFCLSGCVERPGVYEVEHGITLRELLEMAGGVRDGKALQGDPARRRGGVVRHARRARPAAHVRGRPGRGASRSGRAS